jgi:hypothetical protein
MKICSYDPMSVEEFNRMVSAVVESLDAFERGLYDEWVDHHTWECWNNKTTVAILKLKNGFEVVGTAGCENPDNFIEHLGHKYAVKDALRKLGEFAAFHRAEKAHQENIAKPLTLSVKLTPEQVDAIREAFSHPNRQIGLPKTGSMYPGIDVKQTLTLLED